jgi:hypothetical protein
MFGIDLEPNRVDDRLEQILIRSCWVRGNVGGGIQFGLHKLAGWGIPPLHETTISVQNCTIDGSGPVTLHNGHHRVQGVGPVSGIGVLLSAGGYAPNVAGLQRLGARGWIDISNCSIHNTLLQGIKVAGKPVEGGLAVAFRNVAVSDSCHYNSMLRNQPSKYASPILVEREDGINTGSILFDHCTVLDQHEKNRSFFSTGMASHCNRGTLRDVHGTFTVRSSYGCYVKLGAKISNVSVVATSCTVVQQ